MTHTHYPVQNRLRSPGIILRTAPLRESDLIATLLCRDKGRINVLARGARRSKRRFMSGLDLFDCGLFEIVQPQRETQLPTLQSLDSKECWPAIRESLTAFRIACYCAEITLSLTAEGDPSTGNLFSPLYFTLSTLNKQPTDEHAHSLATFYNLILLQRSGLNYLDDSSAIQPTADTFAWFGKMLETSSVIIPTNRSTIHNGFLILARHTQTLLGHPLSSMTEFL